MIVYPAIDLKDGVCVRLLRGQMDKATVFHTVPEAQAKHFQDQGFQWLHLVDLNGAFAGKLVNHKAVEIILETITIPVQLGGGIRSLETIEYWLSRGVRRVILGTIALHSPDMVRQACRLFPDRIAISIDARQGYVWVAGWSEASTLTALELALRYEDSGVCAIVHTDINRDGAMSGLNIDATSTLASHLTVPVIASGGISSLTDLREIKEYEHIGIQGVIIGRALYDGRLSPDQIFQIMG